MGGVRLSDTSREPAVPVSMLRDAARRAAEATSSRQVARAVKMSALGLRKFIAGSEPHPATVRKLAEWYVRHAADTRALDANTAAAALALLVDGYPEKERERVRQGLLDVLREAHGRVGTKPPPWVSEE